MKNKLLKRWHFPLTQFIALLENEGFTAGVDTHILMHRLIQNFDFPEQLHELAPYLAPVLAQNAEEQALFYRYFKQWFFVEYIEVEVESIQDDVEEDKTDKEEEIEHIQDDVEEDKTDKEEEIKSIPSEDDFEEEEKENKKMVINLDRGMLPKRGLSFAVPQVKLQFPSATLRSVRQMRFMNQTSRRVFDIDKTVKEMAKTGEVSNPCYKYTRKHIAYLMIVEQNNLGNHQAEFVKSIFANMTANNLDVLLYTYETDPRILFHSKSNKKIPLKQVLALHAETTLLYFGSYQTWMNSQNLRIYKWTNIFKQWQSRYWFPIDAPENWTLFEEQAQSIFPYILPLNLDGLEALAKHLSVNDNTSSVLLDFWTQKVDYLHTDINTALPLDTIALFFDDYLRAWIAACAIYPQINWELTLALGEYLSTPERNLCTANELRQLLRLDWFRKGTMPENVKKELVNNWISSELNREIHMYIFGLMEKDIRLETLSKFPAYRMQVAIHKLMGEQDEEKREEAALDLQKELENTNRDISNFVTLEYLDESQINNSSLVIPDNQVKKYQEIIGVKSVGKKIKQVKEEVIKVKISEIFRYLGSASELQAEDIIQPARYNENSMKEYFERPIDKEFEFLVKKVGNVIIIGKPVSGKTRVAYELFKKEEFKHHKIIFPYSTSIHRLGNIKQFCQKDGGNILFLDDINEYILQAEGKNKLSEFINLLVQVLNPKLNIQLIATCRTGIEEFALYDKRMPQRIKENINQIEISPLTEEEKDYFKKQIKDDNNFDQKIGSLLLELDVMKRRYKKLSQNHKDILKILKTLHITQNTSKYGKFSLDILASIFFSKNSNVKEEDFKTILNQLRDKNDAQSFVYLYDQFGQRLKSENLVDENLTDLYLDSELVYFNTIIPEPNDIFEVTEYLNDFKDKTLKSLGFNLNLALNIYLNSLENTNLGQSDFKIIIQKIYAYKEILNPNTDTFEMGIYIAPTYDLALEWFKGMEERRIYQDEISYCAMIYKSPNYEIALTWFAEMKKKRIHLTEVLYNTMISKAPKYELALDWFERMRREHITPNEVSYNTMISKAPKYELALDWFERMRREHITPNEVSYNTMISKAPKYELALYWFERMKSENISPNEVSYNTMISKTPKYELALEWFERMKSENISPNEVSYNTMISKTPKYELALEWFEKMKSENVSPNEISYNTVMSKAPKYELALGWLEEMIKRAIAPNEVSYSTLISKAPTYEQALEWFEKMKKENITPYEGIFNSLIHKSENFDIASEWFEKMIMQSIEPTITIETLKNKYSPKILYKLFTTISGKYNIKIRPFDKIWEVREQGNYREFYRAIKEERRKKNYDYVIELLEEAYRDSSDKNKIGTLTELGVTYRHQRNYQKALETFKKVLEKGDNARVTHELGITYRENGQSKEAIEILKKAVQKGNLQSFNELGITYRENGQSKEAIAILKRAIEKGHIPSFNELGITYREMKEYPEAIAILKRAIEKGHIPSFNELGITYREMKEYPEAIAILKRAIEKGNLQSYYELSNTYRETGQRKEEVEILQIISAITERERVKKKR